MTTTENLREYLDAHGIDGPPTEPGWYVISTRAAVMVVVSREADDRLVYAVGSEHSGRYLWQSDAVRHVPLTLAPPIGRDLDAETVAGVQAARNDLRELAGKGAT